MTATFPCNLPIVHSLCWSRNSSLIFFVADPSIKRRPVCIRSAFPIDRLSRPRSPANKGGLCARELDFGYTAEDHPCCGSPSPRRRLAPNRKDRSIGWREDERGTTAD